MRYATTLRPAPGGGVPQGVRWRYLEAPQDGHSYIGKDGAVLAVSRTHRYGVFEAERELTAAEMQHFDIVALAD
jgi:hypothetical protein